MEEAKNFGFDDKIIAKFTIPGTSVVEFHVDDYDFNRDKIDFGGKPSINFPQDAQSRPLIIIFQDEAIYRA